MLLLSAPRPFSFLFLEGSTHAMRYLIDKKVLYELILVTVVLWWGGMTLWAQPLISLSSCAKALDPDTGLGNWRFVLKVVENHSSLVPHVRLGHRKWHSKDFWQGTTKYKVLQTTRFHLVWEPFFQNILGHKCWGHYHEKRWMNKAKRERREKWEQEINRGDISQSWQWGHCVEQVRW